MPIELSDPAQLEGVKVVGSDGSKLGKVDAVYFDTATERPEWASVKSGFFGSRVSLVPLVSAAFDGAVLIVPFSKDDLEKAPHHDPGRELSSDEEADLHAFYGIAYPNPAGRRGEVATGSAGVEREHVDASDSRRDVSGPTTDDAMTRSEEHLKVGTEQAETGRVRLRKHVHTEHQQVSVPVSHEEVRVEREPITHANRDAALDGPEISEEEHEVTLHAERPVVEKQAEPVERVRLATERVTRDEQVGDEVRKEEIEVDDGRSRD